MNMQFLFGCCLLIIVEHFKVVESLDYWIINYSSTLLNCFYNLRILNNQVDEQEVTIKDLNKKDTEGISIYTIG